MQDRIHRVCLVLDAYSTADVTRMSMEHIKQVLDELYRQNEVLMVAANEEQLVDRYSICMN